MMADCMPNSDTAVRHSPHCSAWLYACPCLVVEGKMQVPIIRDLMPGNATFVPTRLFMLR